MINRKQSLYLQRILAPMGLGIFLISMLLTVTFIAPTTAHAVCMAPNYAVTDNNMYEIGLTGDITLTASLSESADALARDPNNCNLLYYVGKTSAHNLYVMDLSVVPTPTSTLIGATNLNGQVRKLGFNPLNGQLYTIQDTSDDLVTISLSTGATSSIGTISGFANSGGDLTFDELGVAWFIHNNRLYTMSVDLPLTPNDLGSVNPPGGLGSIGWGGDGFLYGVRFDTGAVYQITYTTDLNLTQIGTLNLGGEEINDIASVHPPETFPTAVFLQQINIPEPLGDWIMLGVACLFFVLTLIIIVRRNRYDVF